jgi:hypothetical protein
MSIEIRLRDKYVTGGRNNGGGMVYAGKKQKGGHNGQGTKGALRKARAPLPKGHMEEAHAANERGKRVRVLLPSMKTRLMLVAEYEAYLRDRA